MAVDILAFFSTKGIPEEWLTPTISIKNIDGTILVTNDPMVDVTSWFYSYEFTWDDDWESYIVISDGIDIKLDSRYNRYAWVLSSSGLTLTERDILESIPDDVNEALSIAHGRWLWTLSKWWGWWGWNTYHGISLEELNTVAEYIIWKVENTWENIEKIVEKFGSEILEELNGLIEIKNLLQESVKFSEKNYVKNIDIDYDRIIKEINSIKSSVSNDEIKNDIVTMLEKMDAYKQLDIMDIIDAVEIKFTNIWKLSDEKIIAEVKNNFKDLNNKISDLKEMWKVSEKERTQLTNDVYDLLKKMDWLDMPTLFSEIKSLSNRIILMHEDVQLIDDRV